MLTLLGGLILPAGAAQAYKLNDRLEVYGYAQTWLTLYEQMEDARGLFQFPSGDEATDATTGFRLQRARIGVHAWFLRGIVGASLQLKAEGDFGLLDVVAKVRPHRVIEIWIGQFKIPSTAENLADDRKQPFLLKTRLSEFLADYGLSRTTYASSLFYGNRSSSRDLGVGLKLEVKPGRRPIRAFVMAGNGLGANLFISGNTQRGFLITNKGQLFWAGRVEVEPVPGWLVLGGHGSYNQHDNVVFNSGRAVLDLYRVNGSGDVTLTIPPAGITLSGLGGYGVNLEDENGDGKQDFRYGGVAAHLLWNLTPLLRHLTRGRYSPLHQLSLEFRYEWTFTVSDEAPERIVYQRYTAGATYAFRDVFKVQFNAILNRTAKPFVADLDDDAFILGFQASF